MPTLNRTATIAWPSAFRRYLGASLALNLAWEIVQLPLFTLWRTGTLKQQAFAIAHCTIGDLMIAGLTFLVAVAVFANADWPRTGARPVWLLTLAAGVGYTIYSEWINVSVRGTWAYSDLMPIVPIIGTGLAPLLQWCVVPTLAFWIATGRTPWQDVESRIP
jgi:hypothetical protein